VSRGNGGADDDLKEDAPGSSLKPEDSVGLEPAPGSEVDSLRADLKSVTQERDVFKDQFLRKRADFENYKKRVERDREQVRKDAVAEVMKGLIPVLDDLERAKTIGADAGALHEGVDLILRTLLQSLQDLGLVIQDPTGERFNPEAHQALSHEAVPGFEEGTIVEVFRKAYFFKDRLLRPALVKVAKGPEGEEEGAKNGSEAIH